MTPVLRSPAVTRLVVARMRAEVELRTQLQLEQRLSLELLKLQVKFQACCEVYGEEDARAFEALDESAKASVILEQELLRGEELLQRTQEAMVAAEVAERRQAMMN